MPLIYDLVLALQTDRHVATFEIPLGFKTSELDLDSYHGLSHHGKEEDDSSSCERSRSTSWSSLAGSRSTERGGDINDTLVGHEGYGVNKDLPVLLAGGGLNHQGHLVGPEEKGNRIPLSNLWLSSLQWFGLEVEQFGRSTGTFSPMEIA